MVVDAMGVGKIKSLEEMFGMGILMCPCRSQHDLGENSALPPCHDLRVDEVSRSVVDSCPANMMIEGRTEHHFSLSMSTSKHGMLRSYRIMLGPGFSSGYLRT